MNNIQLDEVKNHLKQAGKEAKIALDITANQAKEAGKRVFAKSSSLFSSFKNKLGSKMVEYGTKINTEKPKEQA